MAKTKLPHGMMTKSPMQLARVAMEVGDDAMERYSCARSRHDFTQAQLFAILALKEFFREDYRGIIELLGEFTELRQTLELSKLPHYSTLCVAHRRILKKAALRDCLERLSKRRSVGVPIEIEVWELPTPLALELAMPASTTSETKAPAARSPRSSTRSSISSPKGTRTTSSRRKSA